MKPIIDDSSNTELEQATTKLHTAMNEIINFATDQVVQDTDKAEGRLKKLTQEILDELTSEVADAKQLRQDEATQAKNDIQYKMMLDEYNEEQHAASEDEVSIRNMIREYKKTVDSIRSPTGMTQSDVDQGYEIIDRIRTGVTNFREGQDQMRSAMEAHSYPIDEDAPDLIAVFEQYLSEGEFMVQHESMRENLDKWQTGTMSDQEILLEIERVSPGLLQTLEQ
jgi:hypothetical protein